MIDQDTSERGFPLGLLFVILTASATIAAGLAPIFRSLWNEGTEAVVVAMAIVAGTGGGALLGGVMGLLQYRWMIGGCIGATAGAIVGAVAGVLMLAPAQDLPRVAIAFTAGSCLTVGVALMLRRANR